MPQHSERIQGHYSVRLQRKTWIFPGWCNCSNFIFFRSCVTGIADSSALHTSQWIARPRKLERAHTVRHRVPVPTTVLPLQKLFRCLPCLAPTKRFDGSNFLLVVMIHRQHLLSRDVVLMYCTEIGAQLRIPHRCPFLDCYPSGPPVIQQRCHAPILFSPFMIMVRYRTSYEVPLSPRFETSFSEEPARDNRARQTWIQGLPPVGSSISLPAVRVLSLSLVGSH